MPNHFLRDMSTLNIILLAIIGSFGLFGLWFGFVHTLGSLFGTILGAYIASRTYEPLSDLVLRFTGWDDNTAKVVVFVLAFFVVNRLVGFVFWIAENVLKIITTMPFIRSINRLLGLALGVFEGIITIGLAFFFMEKFPLSAWITDQAADSMIVQVSVSMAAVLMPFVPEALRTLDTHIDRFTDTVSSTMR